MDRTVVSTARSGDHAVITWNDGTEHWVPAAVLAQALDPQALWAAGMDHTARRVKSWRESHRLTQPEAARVLGLAERMWRYYEKGEKPVPRTVLLAMDGFNARLGLSVTQQPAVPGTAGDS